MTDFTGNTGNNAETDPRFENIAAYVLDALENENEREAVEMLIAVDPVAQAEFEELSEAADLLAIAVPPISPPARLKARILELAASEPVQQIPTVVPVAVAREFAPVPWWTRLFRSGYVVTGATAMLVLVAVVTLGIQNNHLGGEIDSLRSELDAETAAVASLRTELATTMTESESTVASMKGEMDQMGSVFDATTEMVVQQEEMVSQLALANTALRQALSDQAYLTYVSTKEGYRVESWLANAQPASNASGLFAVRVVGNEAVFQVHGLEQPRAGFAYTLWLLGNGEPKAVSQFEVSEIGSAIVTFSLPAPFLEYSSLVVTQERVDRIGTQPSDVKFLSADAN